MEQLEDVYEFVDNPDPRSPVSIVLDCSDSMTQPRPGERRSPMEALNSGLEMLVTGLHSDPLARRRAEISFVTFGTEVSEPTDFMTVDNLVLPELAPMGLTSMAEAIRAGLDSLEARKKTYRDNGVTFYRPQMLFLTDGLPTSSTEGLKEEIARLEENKSLAFFAIGVDGADMDTLNEIAPRGALKLDGMKFDELFQWLSSSVASVSASTPGDTVPLPSPAGWAEI